MQGKKEYNEKLFVSFQLSQDKKDLRQVRHIGSMDKQKPIRKAKNNKATLEQQTLSSEDKSKLKSIETRQKNGQKTKTNDLERAIKGVNTPAIKHTTVQPILMLE